MSRPWVKLATKVYTDPAMLRLPRDVFGNFCMCLAMAGAADEEGRIGPLEDVAFMLHISDDEMRRTVDALGGRLKLDNEGVLWVRDWGQWQAPPRQPEPPEQVTERSRRWREGQRVRNDDATQPLQAAGNGATPTMQRCNGAAAPAMQDRNDGATAPLELDIEVDRDTETDSAAKAAAAAVAAARPAGSPNGATPGPADGGRKRAGGLGPGGTLLREVCRLTPPIAVRERIEAVCARYGEDRLREVATEWVSRGHRPHNWSGILDVVEHGWQRQNGNGRRHLPPDEAAAVERMVVEGMEAATERIAAGPDRAVLLWHEVLAVLEERVLPTTHRQWFVPLVPVSLADGVLSVRPPTPAVRDLVRSRGLPLVAEAMADVAPGVQFELLEMAPA